MIRPALRAPRGLARVRALFDRWLAWGTCQGFVGGRIFIPASFELDDQPGAARDYLVTTQQDWLDLLVTTARKAVDTGDFGPTSIPHNSHTNSTPSSWASTRPIASRGIPTPRIARALRLNASSRTRSWLATLRRAAFRACGTLLPSWRHGLRAPRVVMLAPPLSVPSVSLQVGDWLGLPRAVSGAMLDGFVRRLGFR